MNPLTRILDPHLYSTRPFASRCYFFFVVKHKTFTTIPDLCKQDCVYRADTFEFWNLFCGKMVQFQLVTPTSWQNLYINFLNLNCQDSCQTAWNLLFRKQTQKGSDKRRSHKNYKWDKQCCENRVKFLEKFKWCFWVENSYLWCVSGSWKRRHIWQFFTFYTWQCFAPISNESSPQNDTLKHNYRKAMHFQPY